MTVGIYVRVSTREQAIEGYSIPAQRENLTNYCKSQGWKDYRFYVDEGISAKDTNRPQLKELLLHVRERKISTILVYRLDRFTRSVIDLYQMIDLMESANCAFKSATEPYDTSSAMGRMFIGLVGLLAQWERENLGERVAVALEERARQLKAIGKAPFGFKTVDEYYVVDEETAPVVRFIIEKAMNGLTVGSITRALNERNTARPTGEGVWYPITVRRVLDNPALYGAYHYQGKTIDGAFEGYITKAEWELIQQKLLSRAKEPIRGMTMDAIFQGCLSCPNCGHRLSPAPYYNKRGEKTNYSYKCRSCRDQRDFHKSYSEKKLLDALKQYMQAVILTTKPPQKEKPMKDERQLLEAEVNKLEKQRLKYQRAWSGDLMTDEEFSFLMAESKEALDRLRDELANLPENEEVNWDTLKNFAWLFTETFANLTALEKREFTGRFFKKIDFEVVKEDRPELKRPAQNFVITAVEYYL